jgi:hypothetical protein
MKSLKTLFIALSLTLGSCSDHDHVELITDTTGPKAANAVNELNIKNDEIEKHLYRLIVAQQNFFKLTGRWSMTIETLVISKYLNVNSAAILTNKTKLKNWTFKLQSLPFADEDVSWCITAHETKGRVILASHKGLWQRFDGKLSLLKENLPPETPWEKIER